MEGTYFQLEYEESSAGVSVGYPVTTFQLEYEDSSPDILLEQEQATIVSTSDHRVLSNRETPDSHPIEAITNLRTELDSKITNNILQSSPGDLLIVGSTSNVIETSHLCCDDIALKSDVNSVVQDKNYTHTQSIASKEWKVRHNLNKNPSVSITDSSGNVVHGDIQYINLNEIHISFNGIFSGKCYCN